MTYDEAVAYRFPFAPVHRLTARRSFDRCTLLSPVVLAHMLRVHRDAIVGYMVAGLPWDVADRVAVRLDAHPRNVWAEWDAVTEAAEPPQLSFVGMEWS